MKVYKDALFWLRTFFFSALGGLAWAFLMIWLQKRFGWSRETVDHIFLGIMIIGTLVTLGAFAWMIKLEAEEDPWD